MMKRILFTTNGHFRPYRSAAMPVQPSAVETYRFEEIKADRKESIPPSETLLTKSAGRRLIHGVGELLRTSVMPQVICAGVLLNSSDSSSTVSETVKKSKASQLQARKATRKNNHCCRLSSRNKAMGFGALFMGGFNDDSRVAKYLATVMCSC